MDINFEPLTLEKVETYIEVGLTSYNEHYLHLWKNQDASAFIEQNLTKEAVIESLTEPNQKHYNVQAGRVNIGILKLTLDAERKEIPPKNILLNKIYLLQKFSGQGFGKKTLMFVERLARKNQRNFIWLYAMKKGKAKDFYQKNGYKILGDTVIALSGILDNESEMWVMGKTI